EIHFQLTACLCDTRANEGERAKGRDKGTSYVTHPCVCVCVCVCVSVCVCLSLRIADFTDISSLHLQCPPSGHLSTLASNMCVYVCVFFLLCLFFLFVCLCACVCMCV